MRSEKYAGTCEKVKQQLLIHKHINSIGCVAVCVCVCEGGGLRGGGRARVCVFSVMCACVRAGVRACVRACVSTDICV